MITGDIKNQVDRIWDAFWSGGISNPLEVIEQITYLLFIRRLDDLHTLEERCSLVLANLPFAGSLDYENTAKDLLGPVPSRHSRPSLRHSGESRNPGINPELDPGFRRGDDFDGTPNPAPLFEPGVGALFVAFWYHACQGHAVTRSYDKL
jgi:hypothetical protein